MKSKVAVVLAALVVAASTAMGGTVTAKADVNVYTTPGVHNVNGREWRTTCEAYSQTKRCRTEIKATQVSEVKGRFVAKTDWVFNNLTYLPAARALWKGNPLGGNGVVGEKVAWTAPDGRTWSTECDTSTTGSNGCRSYTVSKVIEAFQSNGTWSYRWVTKSVFNNIVMFGAPTVQPVVNVPDADLRECINDSFDRPARAAITKAEAAKVLELTCFQYGISDLTGLERFGNLEVLSLDGNSIRVLAPLQGLRKLQVLTLFDNFITDVSPLAGIASLELLDLAENSVRDIAPLAKLKNLAVLDLTNNRVEKVAPLAKLPVLGLLGLHDNPITDRASLDALIADGCHVEFDNVLGFDEALG